MISIYLHTSSYSINKLLYILTPVFQVSFFTILWNNFKLFMIVMENIFLNILEWSVYLPQVRLTPFQDLCAQLFLGRNQLNQLCQISFSRIMTFLNPKTRVSTESLQRFEYLKRETESLSRASASQIMQTTVRSAIATTLLSPKAEHLKLILEIAKTFVGKEPKWVFYPFHIIVLYDNRAVYN